MVRRDILSPHNYFFGPFLGFILTPYKYGFLLLLLLLSLVVFFFFSFSFFCFAEFTLRSYLIVVSLVISFSLHVWMLPFISHNVAIQTCFLLLVAYKRFTHLWHKSDHCIQYDSASLQAVLFNQRRVEDISIWVSSPEEQYSLLAWE